jgi:hypothetical protein
MEYQCFGDTCAALLGRREIVARNANAAGEEEEEEDTCVSSMLRERGSCYTPVCGY